MELLTACKRLVERRPACGPLVWVCARILSGSDPAAEAHDCVAALQRDRTVEELAGEIPSGASVLAAGLSEASREAALWRPDLDLWLAEPHDAVDPSVRRSDQRVDLVILEADVVGEGEALLRSGAGDSAPRCSKGGDSGVAGRRTRQGAAGPDVDRSSRSCPASSPRAPAAVLTSRSFRSIVLTLLLVLLDSTRLVSFGFVVSVRLFRNCSPNT